MSGRGQPVLRASEVGRYTYCARAWWLQRVMGVEPHNLAALQRGTAEHAAHGRGVERSRRQALWAAGLALVALAALCAWVITLLR